ncbi:hypothetical protein HBH70_124440 [Parastagonospora nodorum]|nr:hypothetical protein HBH51_139440 [Parastagonospora nodorum]KAH4188032.1 hypothetical protein HBH42_153910 [Parastagonospora nodorum]KAH4260494.1 hypothetical protein HBI03_124160 [Parastagonospora nodorum]KAH4267057.1 hypothetical protein HBI04_170860 [Parastagonospora nodorum]KAH4817946.1 hypothetical protein HBH61_045540 [Parastagonospora nodorum]
MSKTETAQDLDEVLAGARAYTVFNTGRKLEITQINGVKEAVAFLSVRKGAHPLLDNKQRGRALRLLAIPTTKDAFFGVQKKLFEKMRFDNWEPLQSTTNVSPTGSQLQRNENGRIVLETPWKTGPLLYLYIDSERSGFATALLGFFVYDMEIFNPNEFFLASRADVETSDSGFPTVSLLTGWLAERYLEYVQEEAKQVESEIDSIAMSDNDGRARVLSKAIRMLNKCSHDIKSLNFDRKIGFALDLANWASGLLRDSKSFSEAHSLLNLVSKHPELHPDQLRERIAQTRAEITDLAAQQRQEQDELQRARAYQLQELSIKIAEDSRRDSRTMRGIAWVTMAFLPATFVTSFFGMNFFDGIADKRVFDGTSRNIWVFFVIALPISAVVLVVFWWWDRKTQVLEQVEREAREKALAS